MLTDVRKSKTKRIQWLPCWVYENVEVPSHVRDYNSPELEPSLNSREQRKYHYRDIDNSKTFDSGGKLHAA